MPARTQQRESPKPERMASFAAIVKQAAEPAADGPWWFVVLPRNVSERLPRRGRTSVQGRINGAPFLATLEPDGKLSHWLKIDKALLKAARATAGSEASVELSAVEQEPEPQVPAALQALLDASPDALATWNATTTLARVDWIHWIESAKQPRTRSKRTIDAASMLASGKGRVCCFDPSGYYAKSMCAPQGKV